MEVNQFKEEVTKEVKEMVEQRDTEYEKQIQQLCREKKFLKTELNSKEKELEQVLD